MFEKILLAVDGSENSLHAADSAIKLAEIEKAQVEILFVTPAVHTYPSRVVFSAAELEKEYLKDAEEAIAQTVVKFKEAGTNYFIKILSGDPADVICHEAEKNKVSVIVMGSRGLNTVSRFVLGSVSTKVLAHAHCSVLIIR